MSYQNFEQIIKQEWEKEFLESVGNFEGSILDSVYGKLVERICTQVWNQALDTALNNVEVVCDSSETFQSIDSQSILKLKIDEQGTDTTEVF